MLECPCWHMVQTPLLSVCEKHLEKFGDAGCWGTGPYSNGAKRHRDRHLTGVIGLRILIGGRIEDSPSVLYPDKQHTQMHMHTYVNVCTHLHIQTYKHMCTHTLKCIHTYTITSATHLFPECS